MTVNYVSCFLKTVLQNSNTTRKYSNIVDFFVVSKKAAEIQSLSAFLYEELKIFLPVQKFCCCRQSLQNCCKMPLQKQFILQVHKVLLVMLSPCLGS